VDVSPVSKQKQAEEFQNTHRKHNPTSTLQIATVFNHYGPVGGCFGGLVDIANKMALANE
jgi:hypothetical protein